MYLAFFAFQVASFWHFNPVAIAGGSPTGAGDTASPVLSICKLYLWRFVHFTKKSPSKP